MYSRTILILSIVLLTFGCSRTPPPEPQPTWRVPTMRPTPGNRIAVKIRPSFRGTLSELLPSRSIQSSRGIAGLGIQILELRSTVNPDAAILQLRARPEVEWAEFEWKIPPDTVMKSR